MKRLLKKEINKIELISPKEQNVVCAHEAGHVLMILNSFMAKDISSVTVSFDRMHPGGCTKVAASHYITKEELLEKCKVFYAGMIGEEMLLGEVSTGAIMGPNNDIEKANELLRKYVIMYTPETSYTGLDTDINKHIIEMSNELISEIRTLFLANKHFLIKIFELLKKKKDLSEQDITKLKESN